MIIDKKSLTKCIYKKIVIEFLNLMNEKLEGRLVLD